jgi:hypothetical protein
MFAEVSQRHHTPHFHARYGEHLGVFGINPVAMLAGSLPRKQARLVEAWAELHQEELLADWQRMQDGRPALPIEPLK